MAASPSELGIVVPEGDLTELNLQGLNRYLGALFQLRESLLHTETSSEDLKSLDYVLGVVLRVAVNRSSIDEVMGRAQFLGWVDNGIDIWPLLEPHLRTFYESLQLPESERKKEVPMIGVVGKIASGKGTVAELLASQYDVLSFPFSERLRAIALALGYRPPFTRVQLRTINDVFKPMLGNQVFVEWTVSQAQRQTKTLHRPDLIVVDGFRSVEETEFFLQQPHAHLIAIIADENEEKDRSIRYSRQLARQRGTEDSNTYEKFLADERVESDWISPVIDLTRKRGYVIYNSGDMTSFGDDIARVIREILSVDALSDAREK